MNRIFSIISLATLLVAGCGSSGNNGGGGGNGGTGGGMDLSAGGEDMSMTLAPDMSPALGCHGLELCIAACTAGDTTCLNNCVQSATQMAIMLASNVRRCERRTCNPVPDGGPAPCMNGGGAPTPQCTMCQTDVFKMSGTCGADTTYCGACYTQYQACQANLP